MTIKGLWAGINWENKMAFEHNKNSKDDLILKDWADLKMKTKVCDFSPVVGQEEEVGNREDHLQPAPVRDEESQQREEEVPQAEEHLVQYAHRPSVVYSHDLRD